MAEHKKTTPAVDHDMIYMRALLGYYLRRAREGAGFSIRELEKRSGIINSEISRIEMGTQECRLESFVRLCWALGIPCGMILDQITFNDLTAQEKKMAAHPALAQLLKNDDVIGPVLSLNMAAIASFAKHLIGCSRPVDRASAVAYPDDELRSVFIKFANTVDGIKSPSNRRKLQEQLEENPVATLGYFGLCDIEILKRVVSTLVMGKPAPDSKQRKAILEAMKYPEKFPLWMPFAPSDWPLQDDDSHATAKTALDEVHASVNTDDVKAQWPLLKKRLQKATEPVGLKSRLAEFLGVKLASVSQWLSDSESQREPGAETTLRMLRWVELQERKT